MPSFPILDDSMRSVSGFFEPRKVSPSVNDNDSSLSACVSSRRMGSSEKRIPQTSRFLSVFGKDCDVTSGSRDSKNVSDDDEHDLAAMVHDFIENGSGVTEVGGVGLQTENSTVKMLRLGESLQGLVSARISAKKDVLWNIYSVLMNFSDADLSCQSSSVGCDGKCLRNLIVKTLRNAGYNAALCRTKWTNSPAVPGGDYEYIEIGMDTDSSSSSSTDRLIIDTEFQAQFAIARPVSQYQAMLNLLPVVFVGKASTLEQIVEIMCQAARCSLQQNSMPLPPWRTSDYMKAKWFSPCHKSTRPVGQGSSVLSNRRCQEQLAQLKSCLRKESKALPAAGSRSKIFARAIASKTGSRR